MISMTVVAVICDIDNPCSVNTALQPESFLQNHFWVQPDLRIFGALSPIKHISSDICPWGRRNEFLRPSFLLHRSPLCSFWLSSGSMPKFFQLLLHRFICWRNFHGLVRRNKFLDHIVMLQWIVSFSWIWSSWRFGNDTPRRSLVDSSASRIHACLVLILLVPPLPQFFFIMLQGIAGATGVSNFLRAFLMVSLNSLSSGSMK